MKVKRHLTDSKLSNGRRAASAVVASAASVWLVGCASTPTEPVSERLDPDTATTVTILSRPIELLSNGMQQTSRDGINDPFAYIAPFETDRMGTRDLYLWVSTPKTEGPLQPPQVLCNGETLTLQPLSDAPKVDLTQLSLSREPYDAPVPWSNQWYFKLSAEGLKCLADANGITVESQAPNGSPTEFKTTERKNLASLDAFTRR
jgi:hypothetical protein